MVGQQGGSLGRYHLENYFLEETVIAAVFEAMEPQDSPLRNPSAIRARLKKIAQSQASYAVALAASSELRELAGNIDVMPKDCAGKDDVGLCEMIAAKAAEESARVTDVLTRDKTDAVVSQYLRG